VSAAAAAALPELVLEQFGGAGGWDEAVKMLRRPERIVGVDIAPDAVSTARAAGHERVLGSVTEQRFEDWLRAVGLISSPVCPTFSDSGLRSGLADYQLVLDVWTSIGWGIPAEVAMADARERITDPRTALLATAGIWALSLPNLRWLAMEQVPAVEFAWEDLAAELADQGWAWVDVYTLDAAQFGLPARRRRSYLVARRYAPPRAGYVNLATSTGPSMAGALGWDPGHRVVTRGNRKPTGGGSFSADGPSWCLTGRSRSWEREADRLRLTESEAGLLNGFRRDYPWTGSRTSRFRQAGDVVSPVMGAHILGATMDVDPRPAITDHLAALYAPRHALAA
jgi:DNA (cytosine-5)-methyltransferase 1